MATAQERASERIVVLLRPKEKQRLQRLARNERVSTAEIVRRSLTAYLPEEDPEAKRLMKEMLHTIDRNLASIRANNDSISARLEKIHRRRSRAA